MPTSPRRALLVIDVQNEYFPGGQMQIAHPPVTDSLPRIVRAMEGAQAAGLPVVVVQHTAPLGAPIFDKATPRWQLHPDVAAHPADHHIEKQQASAFADTDLADWLAQRGIDTVAIVGYMTHNCDASTAIEAAHRGLAVEFLHDASGALPYANTAGSASAEEIHRVFSVVLHSSFAAVVSTDQWLAAVQSGQALPRDNVYTSHQRARQPA